MNQTTKTNLRQQIVPIILGCLAILGEEISREELKSADENTRLFGEKSGIDSIGLVTLLIEVEARISQKLGKNIVIADERAMSLTHSPFRRVGTLADYIIGLIEKP
ncbi:MAG TPA: hypothetical protein P5186_11400 [Candidatus Paceibacterota bacterium]|nr:hypothetical protein [Candidatus Paceibacterota bacterium]